VDGLSLTIPRGQVLGLLGPNGSGKTTTISCILQLLTYDKGSIRVFGEPMTPTSYGLKRRIGAGPQGGGALAPLGAVAHVEGAEGVDVLRHRELIEDGDILRHHADATLDPAGGRRGGGGAAWWPRRSPSSAWRSS